MTAVGISIKFATSFNKPSSMIASPPIRDAAWLTCSTMEALRSSLSRRMPASRMVSKYLSADAMVISGEPYGRKPRETLPETTPAYSNGITMSPSSATYQRMGREKATPESFQRMDFSNLMLSTNLGNASANTSGAGRPFCLTRAKTYFPPSCSRTSSAEGSMPFFLAKPIAAGV